MDPQAPQHKDDAPAQSATPIQPLAASGPQPIAPAPAPADPLQPAATPVGPPQSAANGGKNQKLWFGVIGAVVLVAIIATVIYMLLPKRSNAGASLTVNNQPYLYACSATTPSVLASTLGFSTDRNNQAINTTYQYAPASTGKLDLLTTTGAGSTTNSCQLYAAAAPASKDNQSPDTKVIYTSINQYPNAQDASLALTNNKQQGDTPLPAFPNSSFYSQPQTDSSDPSKVSISAFIAYKNAMIGYVIVAPQGANASDYVDKFTTLARAAAANIDNGSAAKLTTFQHYNTLNGNQFVDACTTVNYSKLSQVIAGGINLNPDGVTGEQEYGAGATYSDPQTLNSVCTFTFRTTAEQKEQGPRPGSATSQPASTGSDDTSAYDALFPHTLSVGVSTVAHAGDVQKAEDQYAKGQGATTLSKTKINGLDAYKASSSTQDQTGNKLDVYQYFVAKDTHLYTLQIVMRRQNAPFKTTDYAVTDAEAAKIFAVITKAE